MSRWIDAEWIMEYFKRGKEYKGEYVLDDLKYEAPSIGICFCEECMHADEKPIADGRYWCNIHRCYMRFCSDGEREGE